MKKQVKNSIVLISAIGITAFLAFYIPNASSIKGRDGYKSNTTSTSVNTATNDVMTDAEVSSKASTNPVIESVKSAGTSDNTEGSSNNGTVSAFDNTTSVISADGVNNESMIDTSGDTSNSDTEEEVKPYSQEWVDKKIEEHKGEIDEVDLKNFRYIMSKLGPEKVTAYFENGLSQEDQNELYSYMRNVLTDSEYDAARQLFIEYNWLLYED